MNKIQQNSLITYLTTHAGNCQCHDCQYFGGVKSFIGQFEPSDFEPKLGKIWSYLTTQHKKKGTCDFASLEVAKLAPKHSEIAQCHIESFEDGEYKTIKKIIQSIYE